jgi:hypothetical protein
VTVTGILVPTLTPAKVPLLALASRVTFPVSAASTPDRIAAPVEMVAALVES